MTPLFRLTPPVIDDLNAIWKYIAADDPAAASRVEPELFTSFERLGRNPQIGSKRPELTVRPVRFWTVPRFPNYIVVYRADTVPVQIVAVVHGRRDLKGAISGL